VADLLECLIQIKGVADTPRRLAERMARAAMASPIAASRACAIARRLALVEGRASQCLSLMLAQDRPALPPLQFELASGESDDVEETADAWRAQFSARRAETVATLERCSAEQLGRIGLDASRGPMTVADLVAVMLAHDTDCLGEI
jgi:hypothetical protein